MNDEKTLVGDINHSFYDFRYEENENDYYRIENGLTADIVKKLSKEKETPNGCEIFGSSRLKYTINSAFPNGGLQLTDLI